MPYSILCVEDDQQVAELLSYQLRPLYNRFDHVGNGQAASAAINAENYDLLLLDLSLPDIDGVSLCQSVRETNSTLPIIVLTGSTSECACTQSLNSGADDFLRKPFRIDELKARINALLRRRIPAESSKTVIEISDLTIKISDRQVMRKSRNINLTNKEFDLLEYLARRKGQVFSRSQLLDAIWGDAYDGFDHTVNSHVNRLRAKLEKNPDNPEYVVTVWGVGYKFSSGCVK